MYFYFCAYYVVIVDTVCHLVYTSHKLVCTLFNQWS